MTHRFLWLWHAVISRWLWIVPQLNLNENTAFIQVYYPLWQSSQIPKQITDRDIELFAEHNQVYQEYSCWFSGISNRSQWGRFACFPMLNGTARPRQKKVDCLTISTCAVLSFYIAGYPCLPIRNEVSIFALTSKPVLAPNRNQPVTTL